MTHKNLKKATNTIPASRSGIPNSVDIYVGLKVWERRILLGLTQTQLAEMIGISFQQIQKYEQDKNRICCSRLVEIASVLNIDVEYFFNDMLEDIQKQSPRLRSGLNETPSNLKPNSLARRETLKLVQLYYKITDQKKRQHILNLYRQMADTELRCTPLFRPQTLKIKIVFVG